MFILKTIRNLLLIVFGIVSWLPFFGFYNFDTLCGEISYLNFLEGKSKKVALFLVIMFCVCSIIIYYKEHNKDRIIYERIHIILHHFRNYIFDLDENFAKTNLDFQIRELRSKYKINRVKYTNIKDGVIQFSEEMVKALKILFNKDFNVCIKLLCNNSSKDSDLRVFTLCRAGADKTERERNDSQDLLVCENSDFRRIISQNASDRIDVFSSGCLPVTILIGKLLQNKAYENTSKNCLKSYKSTVVVPIRINNRHLFKKSKHIGLERNGHIIYGFLCVDSKSMFFNGTQKQIKEFVKGMGDILFLYFDKINLWESSLKHESITNN